MAERDYWVPVCANCQTASCWHGEFMCEKAKTSSVVRLKASELRELHREQPSNYSREKLLEVCGNVFDVEPDPRKDGAR